MKEQNAGLEPGMDTGEGGESRGNRLCVHVDPLRLAELPESAGAWHETDAEREAALAWAARRAELLAWVRRQAGRRLTKTERACLEECCLGGRNCRDAGARLGLSPSAVSRGVRRAVIKLHLAARREGPSAVRGDVSRSGGKGRRGTGS